MKTDRTTCRAFSLVEILIVVLILGILAAIAIPKLSGASQTARENSVKEDLRLLRTQLGVYRTHHAVFPGYPSGDMAQTPTAAETYDQMMKYTDNRGVTSATGSAEFKWGPYLAELPINPINNSRDWKLLGATDSFTPGGPEGWLYQPSTGTIRANLPGTDTSGRPFVEY